MTQYPEQKKLVSTARVTGVWYLIIAISGIFGFMVFHPQIFVGGDPQKTLTNLTNLEFTARIRLLFELLIIVSQALAAVWFYKLFRGINEWAAWAVSIWGMVNSVAIMISAISISSALDVAKSAQTYQEKLVMIQLLGSLITNAWDVGSLFFGLWLIPMGYIVVTSKRMPVGLGLILIVGGVGYLVSTFVKYLGVDSNLLELLVIPATVGEFWMIGYLLIYGIRPITNNEK